MIKYFCDITGEEMEPNRHTKERVDFSVTINGREVHMRSYFCVDNEGSGDLSIDGIIIFLKALVDDHFGVHYLDDLDKKIDLDSYCNDCDDLSVNGVNCRECSKLQE